MNNRIIRKPEARKLTGLSDATLWRMEQRGDFPKRRQIGPNAVGYLASEVLDWIEARPHSRQEEPTGEAA